MNILTQHSQWNDVKEICQTLEKAGHTAWLAGGCVRDALMNVTPKDIDVATSATPEQVEKLFKKTVAVGKAFGVIRVVTKTGDIEVATFRKDGVYTDGRHPLDVTFSKPEEDAKRRDFTVNAIFYDPIHNKIHDYVSGQEDLKKRVIRTVGEADKRFDEDKLRILRAVRFISQLDFEIEDKTLKAVNARAKDVLQVSHERLRDELDKMFIGMSPQRGVNLLISTGLLKILFPKIDKLLNAESYFKNLSHVSESDKVILGWLKLLESLPSQERKNVSQQFKLSNDLKKNIDRVFELVDKAQQFNKLTLSEKKKLVGTAKYQNLVGYLKCSDVPHEEIITFHKKYPKLPEAFITSDDLLKLGVKPGPRMGQLLDIAYIEQLNEALLDKNSALNWLKKQTSKN